jgi:hypothetical protein
MKSYGESYPSFFKHIKISDNKILYKMIFDSDRTRKSMHQQLTRVQSLKENIIGAAGLSYTYDPNVKYKRILIKTDDKYGPLTEELIDIIPRMKEFFYRPDYLLEFYAYPSDFKIRSVDQHIFMSEDEIKSYITLLSMESSPIVHSLPLKYDKFTSKAPVYFSGNNGTLYILQNVVGGELRRVKNVVWNWINSRINLGYFASEWEFEMERELTISANDLSTLDPDYSAIIVQYGVSLYSAVLKCEGSVSIDIV